MTRCSRCTPGSASKRQPVFLSFRRLRRPGPRRIDPARPRLRRQRRIVENPCGCSPSAASNSKLIYPCLPRSVCRNRETVAAWTPLKGAAIGSPMDESEVTQPQEQSAVTSVTTVLRYYAHIGRNKGQDADHT